jgi:hypothetical protein
MSFPTFPGHRKKHNKPNLHADTIMKNTVLTVLTTSKGWIIRQAIKAVAGVSAPLTVFLAEHGAGDYTSAIIAGVIAAAAASIEIALSFLARKNP